MPDLISLGIRVVIIDLDDTLMPRAADQAPPSTAAWVEQVKRLDLKLYVASNGSGLGRVNRLLEELDVEGQGFAFKPLPYVFTKAFKKFNVHPGQVAVVGDRILTDILGGNMFGSHTILVAPLSTEKSIAGFPLRVIEGKLAQFLGVRTNA